MTITFESDKDIIVYALEKIISHARDTQYIFLAQSVWWISSILGLQEGLAIHIDNLKARSEVIQIKGPNNKISNPDITTLSPNQLVRLKPISTTRLLIIVRNSWNSLSRKGKLSGILLGSKAEW
jgi:hypothetical protein